jgi:lipid-binding SYLF domain-containing protein
MNIRMMKITLVLCALVSLLNISAFAQKDRGKELRDAVKTSQKATKTLNEIMQISDKSIPRDLLDRAKAVAVFPSVLKAAFIIGGHGGKGVISRRLPSGWGAPAFFKISGGSLGFQIGASSSDVVMLFMTEDSLKNLLEDKFEIGGEAAAAAGPIGRTAKATTDAQLQAAILSYSRSKGLFAGLSLTGAVISADNDANQAVYSLDAKDLLTGANKVALTDIPPATKNFQEALTNYTH